jgi:hypothetical protein
MGAPSKKEDFDMDSFQPEWLVLVLNAILCALVLTVPVLVGFLVLRVVRRGVSEDRQDFEGEVISKLGEIAETQADMRQQLADLSKK